MRLSLLALLLVRLLSAQAEEIDAKSKLEVVEMRLKVTALERDVANITLQYTQASKSLEGAKRDLEMLEVGLRAKWRAKGFDVTEDLRLKPTIKNTKDGKAADANKTPSPTNGGDAQR